MVTLGKYGKATIVVTVLLVALAFTVAIFSSPMPYYQPGEGSVDPASGIHINTSGDITDSQGNSSSSIIHRDGNVYTLTGNTSSMVTIEKNDIVFDGGGFSFVGSQGLRLEKVSNVTVKNLNLETNYLHIILDHTRSSTVQNVSSNSEFILSSSDNNLISNCTGVIRLENSNYNTVQKSSTGEISLQNSNGNLILYNTIGTQGPSLGLWQSSNNVIFGNTFEKFWWWISMSGNNNKIVANNIWAGQIYLADKLSGTNYIYHNNFFNFKWNHTATTNSANIWSSGMRGNYWADYYGQDLNHDGVGDTPYTIDKTNQDNYPLIAPIDIASEPIPGY